MADKERLASKLMHERNMLPEYSQELSSGRDMNQDFTGPIERAFLHHFSGFETIAVSYLPSS